MWWCSLQFKIYRAFNWRERLEYCRNVLANGDAKEGKWRGKFQRQWVASTLHTTSEPDVSNITTADAHSSAASSRLNWRPSADINGPVRLAAKEKSGFWECAITFQTQSTACSRLGGEARQSAHVHCCLQTVGSMCVETFRLRSWMQNFLWKVKIPGLFTQRQTQRHIWRD